MPRSFLRELKRRKVYRVAVAYAIVGWLLIQIATQVFPFFHIPDWSVRLLVLVVLAGFPVALVLAWAFDATPHGIVRTAAEGQPVSRRGRRGTIAVGAVGVSIAIIVGAGYWWWHREAPSAHPPKLAVANAASAPATRSPDEAKRNPGSSLPLIPIATVPAKSVAVMPFANESGDKSEQFFSDGLSEDLITALSQFSSLKVISRESAFQFRDSKDSSKLIGEKLGVAHLLEGSVQRAANEVRITATLVNATDGSILWSQRYDKPYKDLFALQDAITHSVTDALKAKLLTTPGAVVQSDRPPSGSLTAYAAYQHGIAYFARGTEASFHQAIDAFGEAIRLDPKYAAAYAQLTSTWVGLAGGFLGGAKATMANANARKASEAALALDPDSSLAHQARANLLQFVDMDWIGAEAEYQHALQLAPNDAAAQFGLGEMLAVLGQNARAVNLIRQALSGDPRHASWYYSQSNHLAALGKLDDSRTAIYTAIALQPGAVLFHEQLAIIAILRGDAKAALAAAQREPPGAWHDIAMTLAFQAGPDRAAADAAQQQLIKNYANAASYQIAEVYALRSDPGAMFQWLDRAWTARDPGIGYLLTDPLILRYRDDPRFAAFCKKVGLPTTTDAVAMK